jgi:hypothetical protein
MEVGMTKEKWLEQFNQNKEKLTNFVSRWHPGSSNYGNEDVLLPITANAPESMRQSLLSKTQPVNIQSRWEKAVKEQDYAEIMSMLGSAWMGVPESTSCWYLEGFKEAVDLLDDPAEEDTE